MLSKKGLTLMEILASAVMLILVTTGLASIFVAGHRHIAHSRSEMTAGEVAKYFLEPLQRQVRQDEWGSNCLSQNGTNPSGCDTTPWTDPSSNVTYTPTYTNSALLVDAQNPLGRLRKVRLTITWNEPS